MSLREDEIIANDIMHALGVNPKNHVKPVEKVVSFFDRVRADLRAELDGLKHEKDARDRAELIESLRMHWRIPEQDAIRFVDEKHPIQLEHGECRVCEGMGSISIPGCMGSSWENCPKCHGRSPKKVLRLRLPWSPNGEPVPF